MYETTGKLQKKEWTIHNEFKKVANHKVQKATLSYGYTPKAGEYGGSGDIEVWFAPSIPVDAGPNVFDGNLDFVQWGLPGLILEVNYEGGAWRMEAYEVKLSKKPVELIKPIADEKVTFDEFWSK